MTPVQRRRVGFGFIAAFSISVALAVVASYVFIIALLLLSGKGSVVVFIKETLWGTRSAWGLIFFVTLFALAVSAPTALIMMLAVVGPLFYLSVQFGRTSKLTSLQIGIVASMVVVAFAIWNQTTQHALDAVIFYFALIPITVTGPLATVTLWKIARPDRW